MIKGLQGSHPANCSVHTLAIAMCSLIDTAGAVVLYSQWLINIQYFV